MARVEIKGLAVGVVQNRSGDVLPNVTFTCTGTVYAESSGGTTLTGSQLKSNADGELPGWLDEGFIYSITVPSVSKTVAFEVGLGSGGSSLPGGGTVGQALIKQSSLPGDVAFQDTAALSNDVPLADGTGAAGTDNEAARADHVHPGGLTLMPAANPVILGAGGYLTWPTGRSGPGADTTLNREFAIPVVFDAELDLRIGLNITTAGSAGAVFRIGVRADGGGLPGTLLNDLGTIDGTVTGLAGKLGFTPDAGVRYWLSYTTQVAAATISAMQRGVQVPLFGFTNPADIAAVFQTGVTGALPAGFTMAGGAAFTGALYLETV